MSLYVKTPLLDMTTHSSDTRKVQLKMEAYQPSASFKLRGIEYLCVDEIKKGKRHLVAASGGNAGLSVAYVGKKHGVKVTVVIPQTTLKSAIEKLEAEGATVVVEGEAFEEAKAYALSLVEQDEQAVYIPPFDHPKLWAGHASIVDELKEQCTGKPDLIILSVGGGGLMNGVIEGLVNNGWTDTHVMAVETEGANSLYESLKQKKLVTLEKINSIATSLGAKQVAPKAFEYANRYNVIPHLVTDKSATYACKEFINQYRTLVEPACGASLSVVYDGSPVLDNYKNIVVIVCGGAIGSTEKIDQWIKSFE